MSLQICRLAASLALLFAVPAAVLAQEAGAVGTILIAHGAGPEWNAQVEEVARMADTGGPLEVSYLMGQAAPTHRFQDAAQRLVEQGAREIVVVPLLVSSHSGHYEQIRYLAEETDSLSETMLHHLHMAGIERASVGVPLRLTKAIDDSPDVARVLAERALALAESPREQALFLIGHGPNSAEDHAEWMRNLRPVADSVKAVTAFVDVKIGLVRDDAPAEVRAEAVRAVREMIELQHALTQVPVVVVPVLIASGGSTQERLRKDLAGLPIIFRGDALLPHAGMAQWLETRVREAARSR